MRMNSKIWFGYSNVTSLANDHCHITQCQFDQKKKNNNSVPKTELRAHPSLTGRLLSYWVSTLDGNTTTILT